MDKFKDGEIKITKEDIAKGDADKYKTIKVESGKARTTLRDGHCDGFVPLRPLDLSKVNNFSDLTTAMSFTALGGRTLGEGVDVLHAMATDKKSINVLTLSGIMTVAKMGLIICDLIEAGVIHAIVSTGALITHGFIEGAGMEHFKYEFGQMDDKELYYGGYDRIYDTLELESNLDDAEKIIDNLFKTIDASKPTCSQEITRKLGEYLLKNTKGRGVLKSAFEHNVPVYIPAFTDSEMGLDFALFNKKRVREGGQDLKFDPFLDLEHFTQLMLKSDTLGVFTIGGGVPRNWAQQLGPYLDVIKKRYKDEGQFVRYKYGVRICPEPVHWGGLSGCTYSEGVTWGKFVPKDEGGMQAEVLCDATIALPIMAKALLERLKKDSGSEQQFPKTL